MPLNADQARSLKLASRRQGVTRRELVAAGIHRQVLRGLVRAGQLDRIASGVYRPAEHPVTESHCLVIACTAAPGV